MKGLLVAMGVGAMLAWGGAVRGAGEDGAANGVALHWLDNVPQEQAGVTFGVPWVKGAVKPTDHLALVENGTGGKAVGVQTWPLAYWPDGSVKWSGVAMAAGASEAGAGYRLVVGEAPAVTTVLKVAETAGAVDVDTGAMVCHIEKGGEDLFESLTIGKRVVCGAAHLVALREDRSKFEAEGILKEEKFVSRVTKVTVEQNGPVRAVVKFEGMHHLIVAAGAGAAREWLPFVVRLYFTAGQTNVRMVHSFIFDGDGEKDFIKGIGLSFTVPFEEELHNRHVRFVGDEDETAGGGNGEGEGGVWVQPVRLLPGYRGTPDAALYAAHLAGKRMPNLDQFTAAQKTAIESVAVYNDFKLSQLSPDSFSIEKRTTDKSSWLHVNNGRRSPGMAVLGDVSGGIAVGVKRFWEKYPAEIEIRNAATAKGEMTVWLWSPDAPAMDLRHYDTEGHGLQTNYEDWKQGWDSPLGIANSADLTLYGFSEIPSNAELVKMAKAVETPPLLVCTPQYYHAVAAFGTWSLPDVSTPAKKWLEDQITGLFTFYHGQVEERRWYGFWDYGDIMHNYDFGRHEWRYDIGGWAWTNTELMPDMYLYFSFLRTGRADVFRMAEAMTRATSEVDVHHIGQFAPLGSRHNVNHWGDGAKQPRIAGTEGKRFYYYLTGDERTGDLMHEQLGADATYLKIKRIDPRMPASSDNAAFGTDWTAYVATWMTEWERTGKPEYHDRLVASMKSLVTGAASIGGGGGYDAKTGVFTNVRGNGPGYFDMIFGGPEILSELRTMIGPDEVPGFWEGWANANKTLAATDGTDMTGPRAAAYAANVKKDAALGARAWDALIGDGMNSPLRQPQVVEGPDVLHAVHDPAFLGASVKWQLHGPASVQWCLNAIETLELAKDYLPAWEAAHEKAGAGKP